ASSNSQTSSLAQNLRVMRSQIELYKVQHSSTYPTLANFVDQMTKKTNIDGTISGSPTLGPYVQRIPPNPFTNNNVLSKGATGTSDWYFDENTGEFRPNDAAHSSGF